MTLVAVGSTNPVKVNAARRAFTHFFPDCIVTGINVPSGVSDQPIGDEETARGAVARARAALAAAGSDWGVGLEGGVTFEGDLCWMNGFCAVAHKDGRVHTGQGGRFLLPPAIGRAVREGAEVGPLVDRMSGQTGSKQQGGAIGFLTHGLIRREDLFVPMVAAALFPYLHPEWYSA